MANSEPCGCGSPECRRCFPSSEMICSDCGISHADQETEFPVNTEVMSFTDFHSLTVGAIGWITAHCADGRAVVVFNGERCSHTFHNPSEWIVKVVRVAATA